MQRRIDAERFDRVDRGQHALHLRPAGDAQQNLAAGPHERQRLIGLARSDGSNDIDPRDNGTVFVRRPADEGEDGSRRKADDAPVMVEALFADDPAEADAVIDALLAPRQFDQRMVARLTDRAQSRRHGCAPSVNGSTDAMRACASSAMAASISQPR